MISYKKSIKSNINTWFANTRNQYLAISAVLLFAFIIRMYLSKFEGHQYDISTFKIWSRGVYYTGFSHFYQVIGSDYPPFYIYVLWVVGTFYKLFLSFSFDIHSPVFTTLIKMPAMISDIMTAFLIFNIVKKYKNFRFAFFSMIFYAFNPAIIYDSAIWGQMDSVYVMFLMLALMLFISERPVLSGASMTIAILTKPQSLVLLPLFVFILIRKYPLLKIAKTITTSLATFIVLALPFYLETSIFEIFNQYFSAYNQYPYNSMNALNIWFFVGLSRHDNIHFLFISYKMWGYILFGLVCVYVLHIISKNIDDKSIYYASAIIFFAFFMFFTRIHERYLFPMFAPLAVAMTFDRRLNFVYGIGTFTFLLNMYIVLAGTSFIFPYGYQLIFYISEINLIILFYALYCFSTSLNVKKI